MQKFRRNKNWAQLSQYYATGSANINKCSDICGRVVSRAGLFRVRFGLKIDKMSAWSTYTYLVFSPFRYCKSVLVIKITLLTSDASEGSSKNITTTKSGFFSKFPAEISINRCEIWLKTFFCFLEIINFSTFVSEEFNEDLCFFFLKVSFFLRNIE